MYVREFHLRTFGTRRDTGIAPTIPHHEGEPHREYMERRNLKPTVTLCRRASESDLAFFEWRRRRHLRSFDRASIKVAAIEEPTMLRPLSPSVWAAMQ